MWPSNSGYFATQYWVTDFWFDPSTVQPASDRYVGVVRMPTPVGTVQTAGDLAE